MRGWLAALLLMFTAPAWANLSSAELANAGVSPPAHARLPSGAFVDQAGQPVRLAVTPAPTILLFADYTCSHLCGPGITLTVGALHDAGLEPGRDYRMIVIGLDQDGPATARKLIAERLAGMSAEAASIRLLTGSPETVAASEKALGYTATYDKATDQFAHSAATYVFTRDGRLSHVLPETASTPEMLRSAIASARAGNVAAPSGQLEQLVTLCYGLAAAHGVYGSAIVTMLRMLALLTIVALGWFVWRLRRKARPA